MLAVTSKISKIKFPNLSMKIGAIYQLLETVKDFNKFSIIQEVMNSASSINLQDKEALFKSLAEIEDDIKRARRDLGPTQKIIDDTTTILNSKLEEIKSTRTFINMHLGIDTLKKRAIDVIIANSTRSEINALPENVQHVIADCTVGKGCKSKSKRPKSKRPKSKRSKKKSKKHTNKHRHKNK
jgi:hypothetical protein